MALLGDIPGLARAAGRLLTVARTSTLQVARVTPDPTHLEMTYRARTWGRGLMNAVGARVLRSGPKPRGGSLLVANHRSYLDIIAMLSEEPCCFLAKKSVAAWPVIGSAVKISGTVLVDRSSRDSRKAARDTIGQLLEDGVSVGIFPEGTTSPPPGLGDFKMGPFHTAASLGARVVPVAVEYGAVEDAWVGDDTFVRHFFDRFRAGNMQIHLVYGPPIVDDDAERLQQRARSWIEGALDQLWAHRPWTAPLDIV